MRRLVLLTLALAVVAGCKDKSRTWTPVWKPTSPLLVPSGDGIAAVQVNGVIYVMGGYRGMTFLGTTEYARIREDGSLEPWKEGPPMNEPRGYFAAVAKDGFIYVLGGGTGDGHTLLRSVERSKILPDGSLGPWQKEPHELISPRRCAKAVLIGDTIYAIGGFSGDMLNTVEHAKILPGGGTDEWLEEPEKLTQMRYISGVTELAGNVYVAGSHEQFAGAAVKDVEWTKVADEAGFAPWKKTSPLQLPRYGLALVPQKDRLVAIGGTSGKFQDSIEVAPILKDGGLGPWKLVATKLSSPRAMMAEVVYKNWIYLLGGAGADTLGTNVVEYATFNEAGELGSWMTRDELAELEARRKKAAEPSPLPFAGRVIQVLPATPYVYLLVQVEGREGDWLAVPEGDFHPGDKVRFGGAVLMPDFFSKQLNRRFPEVYFVSQIRKEP